MSLDSINHGIKTVSLRSQAMSTRIWTFLKPYICPDVSLYRSGEQFQNNTVSVSDQRDTALQKNITLTD